jgi:uncharacterized protein with PIN domain
LNKPLLRVRGVRLLVDRTAGKLARWLRILGLDTEYIETCDSAPIVKMARQSGRKAVTRNAAVIRRLGEGILLESDALADQVRQVVRAVGASEIALFTRCSVCNAVLESVEKETVKGRIPEYVYENHDGFAICRVCGRYYWRGTHWEKMKAEIERMMGG